MNSEPDARSPPGWHRRRYSVDIGAPVELAKTWAERWCTRYSPPRLEPLVAPTQRGLGTARSFDIACTIHLSGSARTSRRTYGTGEPAKREDYPSR